MRAVVSAEDRRLAKLNLSTNPLMIGPSDNATPGTSNTPVTPAPASSTMEQTQSNPPALEGAQTMESQAEDYNYDEAQVNKAIVTPATEPSSEPEASSRTSPAAPPSDAEPTPTASALTPGADEQAPPLH
ncbi:unnamed protein product [Tilletia caries]|nr:unnamed protein product [Tilletia caries]